MRPIAMLMMSALLATNPGCAAIGAVAGNGIAEHTNAVNRDLIANGATEVPAQKSVRTYTLVGLVVGLAIDTALVSLAISQIHAPHYCWATGEC
jgi:hypothetical protein